MSLESQKGISFNPTIVKYQSINIGGNVITNVDIIVKILISFIIYFSYSSFSIFFTSYAIISNQRRCFKIKLIHECVRDILLDAEENLTLSNNISSQEIQTRLKKYKHEDIYYTCLKLNEAGFIKVDFFLDGSASIEEITYNGHMFLDNIRDNNVWKKTQSILSKFTSTSLGIVQDVAAQVISNIITTSLK